MSFNDDYYKASTPEEHKDEMERLCEEIKKSPLINDAIINDFGRYSNFDLHIYPDLEIPYITQKVKKIVADAISTLKLKCTLSQCFPAERLKKANWRTGKKDFTRSFWAFDIDYNQYNKEQNSFSQGLSS